MAGRSDETTSRNWLAGALLALAPALAQAVGLGAISLESALNQPLEARIPLHAASPAELDGLEVGLADAATFERAGIVRDRPVLALRFEVVRGQGRPFVRVSTQDAVREPVLEFVLEAAWPEGRAARTYTLLLEMRSARPRRGLRLSAATRSPR